MSDNQVAVFSEEGEIPCLLVPMLDSTLILPTVTVAEMAPMQPAEKIPDSPDWLVGYYRWRDQNVPLLSYEGLNGAGSAQLNQSGRVAVLNNTGIDERLPFIAIPTQGIPRMAKVGKSDITENTEAQKKAFDLMAVKVGMEEFYLPDVAALENAYLKLGLL